MDIFVLDIFVLDKYSKQNKGYGYIFAMVDVFSRKAYAYPMKHKALADTTAALKRFFNEPDVKTYKTGFSVIVSYSDSAKVVMTKAMTKTFKKYWLIMIVYMIQSQ
jgi:hypothetical protein